MSDIDNLLCDVRKSFRILALFTERICALVTHIEAKLGVTYQGDRQLWGNGPLSQDKKNVDNKDIWDWLPLYCHAFSYAGSNPAITLTVILQCDTGYWDVFSSREHFWDGVDGNGSDPEIKNYADVKKSKSRLIFSICKKSDVDLANLFDGENENEMNWVSSNNPNMSGEFELPLSAKSKKKAFFKVFDLTEFKNQEDTNKALNNFVQYANGKGFALKFKRQDDE
jgi:hypothetical protein